MSTDDLIVTGFTNAVDRIPNMSPHLPEQKEDAYRFKSLGTSLLALERHFGIHTCLDHKSNAPLKFNHMLCNRTL